VNQAGTWPWWIHQPQPNGRRQRSGRPGLAAGRFPDTTGSWPGAGGSPSGGRLGRGPHLTSRRPAFVYYL